MTTPTLEDLLKNQPTRVKKLIQAAYWYGARDFGKLPTDLTSTQANIDGVISDTSDSPSLPCLLRPQAI